MFANKRPEPIFLGDVIRQAEVAKKQQEEKKQKEKKREEAARKRAGSGSNIIPENSGASVGSGSKPSVSPSAGPARPSISPSSGSGRFSGSGRASVGRSSEIGSGIGSVKPEYSGGKKPDHSSPGYSPSAGPSVSPKINPKSDSVGVSAVLSGEIDRLSSAKNIPSFKNGDENFASANGSPNDDKYISPLSAVGGSNLSGSG